MDQGDIYLADLNEERHRRVLVVSANQFSSLSGRAVVIPDFGGSPDAVLDPWRVVIDGTVYAVDHIGSIPTNRLLERVDRAPADAVLAIRRALRAIT